MLQQIFVEERGQTRSPAPMTYGRTDVKHVCVLITAIAPGAMATEVIFMISTLRNTEIIHGVIPIGETGNAIPSLNH